MQAAPAAELQSSATDRREREVSVFSPRERIIAEAIAATALPAGGLLPGGDARTVAKLERWVSRRVPALVKAFRGLLWAVELGAAVRTGRLFTQLDPERRLAFFCRWHDSRFALRRATLRGLLTPLKAAHFDTPEMHELVGCRYMAEAQVAPEREPWMAACHDGRELTADDSIECDVVIVGSGAGGGTLAYELASRGNAVVLVEAGRYFKRRDFTGRPIDMTDSMYLERGLTMALGNVGVPVWAGQTVGGTTTVNSGTCYRLPESALARWRSELGLPWCTPHALDPYFDRVEAMLRVEEARGEHLGAIGAVIARGAERLGYSHGPLRRNAPDCDGQGVCCFGCPTGAKRSADVTWVPEAMKRGAQLFASCRVDRILTDESRGRATGVVALSARGARITVKARATVVACGAIMTPVLIKRSGLLGHTPMLGRNLSIHPAGKAMALFEDRQDMWRGIPQSYSVEHFRDDGILFEGGSLPFSLAATSLPTFGRRYMDIMAEYPHMALFGYMIADTSRGRVIERPGGHGPLILYNLNRKDRQRVQLGMELLCELFLAAGAKSVLPGVTGAGEIRDHADLQRFKETKWSAERFELTAFHPLGTARMGMDRRSSVVGPDHEAHEVRDLYVVDGAAMPSSLGVNPQITIMAMALRAGVIIDRRLAMKGGS